MVLAAAAVVLYSRGRPAAPDVVAAETPSASSAAPVPPKPPAPGCPELVVARGDALLIEDWEANDSRLLPRDGRKGAWMIHDDGTAKQTISSGSQLFPTLIPGRRGASKRAFHTAGGKFTEWGVTIGVDLADNACYDVSSYGGVEFWARGKGRMYVGLQMIDVQAQKFGGFCAKDCYNVHRKRIELGADWQLYSARWDELEQLWSHGKVDFDTKRVRLLEFAFLDEDTPFEVWIDDVAFIAR
jgi:hypothetical protein